MTKLVNFLSCTRRIVFFIVFVTLGLAFVCGCSCTATGSSVYKAVRTPGSNEVAVRAALVWIVSNQESDGSWRGLNDDSCVFVTANCMRALALQGFGKEDPAFFALAKSVVWIRSWISRVCADDVNIREVPLRDLISACSAAVVVHMRAWPKMNDRMDRELIDVALKRLCLAMRLGLSVEDQSASRVSAYDLYLGILTLEKARAVGFYCDEPLLSRIVRKLSEGVEKSGANSGGAASVACLRLISLLLRREELSGHEEIEIAEESLLMELREEHFAEGCISPTSLSMAIVASAGLSDLYLQAASLHKLLHAGLLVRQRAIGPVRGSWDPDWPLERQHGRAFATAQMIVASSYCYRASNSDWGLLWDALNRGGPKLMDE